MPYRRATDQKACWRRWYKRNRKRHVANSARNKNKKRAEARKVLQELRHQRKCPDCKRRYPYWVMQFDHVRGRKLCEVTQMATHGYTLAKILREVKKCEVVCANCHAERTHRRGAVVQR